MFSIIDDTLIVNLSEVKMFFCHNVWAVFAFAIVIMIIEGLEPKQPK